MRHQRGLVWIAASSLAAWAAIVTAEEIVVQNDSIQNFGTAYIVGDFIVGEHAGVRLTSPCTGRIVAVQILWLEGTPGHPPSLQEAIHIYADAGTFPTPGSELLLLEGPVLTPGYMNEYRYIDEAQQMPINVPVSEGQSFFVTLEFGEPTNVGAGGPSVVRDVDGCQAQRNVLFGNIDFGWNWYNFCMFLAGDLVIRVVVDCQGVLGACCYPDGTCQSFIEEAECVSSFGAVWYEALTCADVACEVRGACCRMGGCLQLTTPAACAAIGGVFAGPGTDCNDGVCITGACCFGDGTCAVMFEFDCAAQGGVFQGIGTSCDPNPCPQPLGACCFGQFCVANQTEASCTGAGGAWGGPWTNCADANQNGVPDACEPDQVSGDMDCDGDVDFDDIDPFVLALSGQAQYEAEYPNCNFWNGDCNGDNSVDFDDIDPFVALLAG